MSKKPQGDDDFNTAIRDAMANKFLACASDIGWQLECAVDEFSSSWDKRQKEKTKETDPNQSLSKNAASSRRPRSHPDPRGEALRRFLDERLKFACTFAAELVVGAVENSLLQISDEALIQIVVMGKKPTDPQGFADFWDRCVMWPLRTRSPSMFLNDRDVATGWRDYKWNPGCEYEDWINTCVRLSEWVKSGVAIHPPPGADDTLRGRWLTPHEQGEMLGLGTETHVRKNQIAQELRKKAIESGMQLRTRKGTGRATDVYEEDWGRLVALRSLFLAKAMGGSSGKKVDARKPRAADEKNARPEQDAPPTGTVPMRCSGCNDIQRFELSRTASLDKTTRKWTAKRWCETCRDNKLFEQSL